MADQSDVETALVQAIALVLYPEGTAAPSVVGPQCRIFRGWPTAAALTADLIAGVVNVTIFPDGSYQHDTTRYSDEPKLITQNTPTLAISVSGATATVSGVASLGQIAGILVDDIAVVHRTQAGDTPELVAATLGAYLRTKRLTTVSGATITIPNARGVIGRVVCDQIAQRETRRQRQGFRVTMWCPSPALRDLIAGLIDQALSDSNWLPLSDGTAGFVRVAQSKVFDQGQTANLYRRDTIYNIEYPTTISLILPSMIFGNLNFAPAGAGSVLTLLA
jgi:hypothetical protein